MAETHAHSLCPLHPSSPKPCGSCARERRPDEKGEAWINYGVEHIHDDPCALCDRDDVNAEGMVTLCARIFGETYKARLAAITSATTGPGEGLGEDPCTTLADKAPRLCSNSMQRNAGQADYAC